MPYANAQDVKRRKPFKWWHEAIIDDMLMHPLDSLKVRAARLGYSVAYLSLIINSDMFKAAYLARREALSDRLEGSISQKAAEAVDKSLDIILETLEKKRDTIPFAQLTDFTDKTLAKLGYGTQNTPPPVSVQINSAVQISEAVSPAALAEAREALRVNERLRATDSTEKVIEHRELSTPDRGLERGPLKEPLDEVAELQADDGIDPTPK